MLAASSADAAGDSSVLEPSGGGLGKAPKVITVVADEWCPYNCMPGSAQPGFAIEIARAVFEPKGFEVRYELQPWARAIVETRAGNFNAIVGAVPDEAPDFIYPTVSQGESTYGFYVDRNNNWSYQGVESLTEQRLGVILEYAYGEAIDAYIEKWAGKGLKVQLAHGDNPSKMNMDKLAYGRITVMVSDTNVLGHLLMLSPNKYNFTLAGTLPADPIYIAFSPALDSSEKYAYQLGRGIEKLRETGELQKIMSNYGLQDWRKSSE